MEGKKYILSVFMLMLLYPVAAESVFSNKIYDAYITGNMSQWKSVLIETEQQKNQSSAFLLEQINYQYGYIGWCLGTNKKTEAKQWMEKMEKNLDILQKRNYQPSMIAAYRGSMIGFKIGLNKLQAPFIGGKSISFAKSAMESDPKNPLGFFLYGNILFYTPEFFGGAKDEAMSHYLQALKNMESNASWINKNWNYLNLLTVIATAYYEYNQQDKALTYLQKALKTEPEFQWVKKELYPKFSKKK
jgi:tetratricopeptide (TPR) repeat protein